MPSRVIVTALVLITATAAICLYINGSGTEAGLPVNRHAPAQQHKLPARQYRIPAKRPTVEEDIPAEAEEIDLEIIRSLINNLDEDAVEKLSKMPEALPFLEKALYEEGRKDFRSIVKALYMQRSDESARVLIGYINSSTDLLDHRTRYVLLVLGRTRSLLALQFLSPLASGSVQPRPVRERAILSMLYCNRPEQADYIFPFLKEKIWQETLGARIVTKMLDAGDERCVPYARDMLAEYREEGRDREASGLLRQISKLKSDEYVDQMYEYCKSKDELAILHSCAALANVSSETAKGLLWRVAYEGETIMPAVHTDCEAPPGYQGDMRYVARKYALVELARLGEKEAVKPLVEYLSEKYDSSYELGRLTHEDIGKVLEQATGRRYGTDYGKWREFLDRQGK